MGSVVAILNKNQEVGRYEYDAWGNCIITKDEGGIASLNPIRWKSQYYDEESGLYYMSGRYYSPVMKSFISPCNFDEILYNITVPGNLNAYLIGNPIYFPVNGCNIFTSMPLVTENHDPDNNWNLPEWVRITIGATAIGVSIALGGIPALIGVGVGAVVGAGFEFGGQTFAGNGFDLGKIGMSALGGATAGGIAAISGGYTAAFLLGGTGAAFGSTVTGSVNNIDSAVIHFGIGAALNVTGKFVGDKIGKSINGAITRNAQMSLANKPIVPAIGKKLVDLVGADFIENAAFQSSVILTQTLINRSMGGFSNSVIYMIMLESINGLMTGWYD